MKKEYESHEIHIEYFDISSTVCKAGSGVGWEEEEELFAIGVGDDKGVED